jgi:hypothetical protein
MFFRNKRLDANTVLCERSEAIRSPSLHRIASSLAKMGKAAMTVKSNAPNYSAQSITDCGQTVFPLLYRFAFFRFATVRKFRIFNFSSKGYLFFNRLKYFSYLHINRNFLCTFATE